MSDTLPLAGSLRQVIGALIFGADHPLSLEEIRKCLREVGEGAEGPMAVFAEVTPGDIRNAIEDLRMELARLQIGFEVAEISHCFRLQSQAACGAWVRQLLKKERPNRLSRPALETLAVIAYRQPIARSGIESVRGVSVGHVLKALVEMHLVRIVGRSDLPGRPFLYGTTNSFLEHFGLKHLSELDRMDPTLQRTKSSRSNPPRKPSQDDEAATARPAVLAEPDDFAESSAFREEENPS